jgi:hypothetical protein
MKTDLEKIEEWILNWRDKTDSKETAPVLYDLYRYIISLKAEKPRYEMEARIGNSTVRAKYDMADDAMYLSEKPVVKENLTTDKGEIAYDILMELNKCDRWGSLLPCDLTVAINKVQAKYATNKQG